MTESQLQQQIISFLSAMAGRYNFIYYAPMNESSSMVMSMFKVPPKTVAMISNWMKKMGFLPGISDIVIMKDGKAYCMELKTLVGKQSKQQIRFEENCKKTGIPYMVVRSLKQCQDVLFMWGVIG